MNRKVVFLLVLLGVLALTSCKSQFFMFEEGGEARVEGKGQESGLIGLDEPFPEYDNPQVFEVAMMDLAMSYLEENPLLRSNYYPLAGNDIDIVKVSNLQIDFGNYALDGDVNVDGFVDGEDLTAYIGWLSAGKDEKMTDLNDDGKSTVGDLYYLCDHLLTEIVAFGFYNDEGEKLDIPSVPYGRETVIKLKDYPDIDLKNGDHVQIVPEDTNGASAMNVLPSPTDMGQGSVSDNGSVMVEEIVDMLLSSFDSTPDKYLVAWSASIGAIEQITDVAANQGDNVVMNIGFLTPYLDELTSDFEEKVEDLHFAYRLQFETRYDAKDYKWHAMAGIPYSNKYAMGYGTDLESFNKSEFISFTTEKGGRSVKHMAVYRNTIMYAVNSSGREGQLSVAGWKNNFGHLAVRRMGPGAGQDDILHEVEVQDGKIPMMEPLYTGDYKVVLTHEDCGLNMVLEEDHVYRHDEDHSFDVIIEKQVKITGRVVTNGEKEPIEDVEVQLLSKCPALGIEPFEPEMTDGDGRFTFENVPYGIYELRLNGENYMDIRLEDIKETTRNLGDLTMGGTFDIELNYSNKMYEYDLTARWMDVEIKRSVADEPELTNRDLLYPENGVTCKALLDVSWPNESELIFHNGDYEAVYDVYDKSEPVFIGIIQESADSMAEKNQTQDGENQNENDVSNIVNPSGGNIYIEISPNFFVMWYDVQVFYYDVPLMAPIIQWEHVQASDPSAGPDDGDMLGFIGQVDALAFMKIFEGGVFERSGVARSPQGIAETYHLTIKPHKE